MPPRSSRRFRSLGQAEHAVMDVVWARGPLTARECRLALLPRRPMQESTVRTMLSRLEEKGFVTHGLAGRAYVYRAAEARGSVAVRAVRNIIERFCGGSAEQLVLGMVDGDVLDAGQLERLARKIRQRRERNP